jgi:hypothetical protein
MQRLVSLAYQLQRWSWSERWRWRSRWKSSQQCGWRETCRQGERARANSNVAVGILEQPAPISNSNVGVGTRVTNAQIPTPTLRLVIERAGQEVSNSNVGVGCKAWCRWATKPTPTLKLESKAKPTIRMGGDVPPSQGLGKVSFPQLRPTDQSRRATPGARCPVSDARRAMRGARCAVPDARCPTRGARPRCPATMPGRGRGRGAQCPTRGARGARSRCAVADARWPGAGAWPARFALTTSAASDQEQRRGPLHLPNHPPQWKINRLN